MQRDVEMVALSALAKRGAAFALPALPNTLDQRSHIAYRALGGRQSALVDAFGLLELSRFELALEENCVRFYAHSRLCLTATVDTLGHYTEAPQQWTWAWSEPTLSAALREGSQRAWALVRAAGYAQWLSPTFTCEPIVAWVLQAHVCHDGNYTGAYTVAEGGRRWHVVLSQLREVNSNED